MSSTDVSTNTPTNGAPRVSGSDPHLRQLLRGGLALLVLGAIVVALVAAVPGLASVAKELGQAQPAWVVLAVLAELASGFAFVLFFQGIFSRGPRRLAARLAWTEMAANAVLPAGGTGGLGLGAWILGKLGMPSRAVAIRSSVVFFITSAVSVASLSLFGLGLAIGLLAGPQKPLLTLLPGLTGLAVIVLFLALPGPLTRLAEKHADRHSRLASMLASLAAGISETQAVLRQPNWRLLGAVGYWLFDVAVLWLAFRAFGAAPPFGVIVMGYLIGMGASALPIPGGIGAVDASLVGMLAVYGAAFSTAVAAVLIFRAIELWVPTLVGTLAYVLLRRDLRQPIAPRGGLWPAPGLASRRRSPGEAPDRVAVPPWSDDAGREFAQVSLVPSTK